MSEKFKEGMINLATNYVLDFQKEPEKTLLLFCKTEVPLMIMNIVYHSLVWSKEIIPIEDLEMDVKEKLWKQAKETCPYATKDKLIKLSKGIWLINFVLEK